MAVRVSTSLQMRWSVLPEHAWAIAYCCARSEVAASSVKHAREIGCNSPSLQLGVASGVASGMGGPSRRVSTPAVVDALAVTHRMNSAQSSERRREGCQPLRELSPGKGGPMGDFGRCLQDV
jgi:hypothetical protein